MRRYWLPKSAYRDKVFNIEGDYYKHICRVCRRQVGDKFEIIMEGDAYLVELIDVNKKDALARIIDSRKLPSLSQPYIHLALSLPKLSTLENVLEKSVELGVHSVHIFNSEFSFIKSGSDDFTKKRKRWEKIIIGATQQTGRGEPMALTFGRDLSVLLEEYAQRPKAWGVFAYEGEGQQSLDQCLDQLPQDCQEVWVFVGSEGGFSPRDVQMFSDYKMIPTSLGSQVLRVETACVTLISVIKYGLGQFK